MTRVKHGLDVTLQWVCIVLLGLLVVTVAWQVFTRQVLSAPSGWSEELAKYVFIWLGLFGSALVFGERGHIAIDLVARRLPGRAQRWNAVLGQLVIVVFAALVLVYGGWKVSALAWDQNLTGLPVNVGWLYTALPASGVLVVFYAVYHLVAVGRRVEDATTDGEPEAV